jgi:predicted negative regulator of RcsB-dependent stress response
VLIAQSQYDAAGQQLGSEFTQPFAGMAAELRGDLHLARGELDKAREAYTQAADSGSPLFDAGALDMKINDLAEPNT